jgi:RNA polymerase sigma factor (sigma-70 family)
VEAVWKCRGGLDPDDAFAAARFGFAEALNNPDFDPTRYQFGTYARKSVFGAVCDAVEEATWRGFSGPRTRKTKKEGEEKRKEERLPSPAMLSIDALVPGSPLPPPVDRRRPDVAFAGVAPLGARRQPEEDGIPRTQSAEDEIIADEDTAEREAMFAEMLGLLSPPQLRVVTSRYLDATAGKKPKPYRDVAEELGMSREWVRKLDIAALAILNQAAPPELRATRKNRRAVEEALGRKCFHGPNAPEAIVEHALPNRKKGKSLAHRAIRPVEEALRERYIQPPVTSAGGEFHSWYGGR